MNKPENKKSIQLFLVLLLLKILNGYFFTYVNNRFFELENRAFDNLSELELFFIAVVVTPIIETLIFQYTLYKILNYLKVKNTLILIVLMSIVFSLAHSYHWLYMLATFFSGLILNHLYISTLKNRGKWLAVLLTMGLHMSYNLFGFLFVD